MVAAAPLYPVDAPSGSGEQRVLIGGVSWATYVMLRDSVEGGGVKMTYLEGWLEITSPSRAHEVDKKQIARFVELFCLERGIPLYGYGSTTFRKEEKRRGLEPDECYARGADKDVPDFALEVIKSHGLLDKLEVYQGLGISEVWLYEDGAFRVVALAGDHYEPVEASRALPELDLALLADFVQRDDQHAALVAFRDAIRK